MRPSVRFVVLRRDDFTCQYCGARAPDVALEVDHIHPRSHGGADALQNLVTSCHDCNQGKRDDVIDDAYRDLDDGEYAEAFQDLTECAVDYFGQDLAMLADDWRDFTGESPSRGATIALGRLLLFHDQFTMRRALRVTAFRRGYNPGLWWEEQNNYENLVFIDVREIAQTLTRWRRELNDSTR